MSSRTPPLLIIAGASAGQRHRLRCCHLSAVSRRARARNQRVPQRRARRPRDNSPRRNRRPHHFAAPRARHPPRRLADRLAARDLPPARPDPARVVQRDERKIRLVATMRDLEGVELAEAEGLFVRVKEGRL